VHDIIPFEFGNIDLACVYDIATSTRVNVCNGPRCARAAAAVDKWQELLMMISPLRTAVSVAMFPALSSIYPEFAPRFKAKESGTCFLQREMASLLHRAHRTLHNTTLMLHDAAAILEVAIVAEPRSREWLPFEKATRTVGEMLQEIGYTTGTPQLSESIKLTAWHSSLLLFSVSVANFFIIISRGGLNNGHHLL